MDFPSENVNSLLKIFCLVGLYHPGDTWPQQEAETSR
jgi:hypothetical protein